MGASGRWAVMVYGAALASSGAALVAATAIGPVLGWDFALLPFYPAVVVVAVAGGLGPGLLATSLSALAIAFFVLPPRRSLLVFDARDLIALTLLVSVGVLVGVLSENLHRARRRAERSEEREREARQEAETARALAESANRAKGQLLTTVVHELRTPLSAILGWAQALLAAGTELPPEIRSRIETIKRNAVTQAQLLEDLFDTSRIESGKLKLVTQPVDLTAVLRHALEDIHLVADVKGVETRLVAPAPAVVAADPDRLQQVFVNLLTNAVKFTDRGGRVTASVTADDARAVVTICDTGRGIRPEALPYIFERLWQADREPGARNAGLGLGLALVRDLVQLHGGEVRAESGGEGQGATFVVVLPLRIDAG